MDNKWKNWLKKNFKRVVTLLLAAVIVVSFCLYHSDDRRLRAGRFSNNTRMTPGTQSEMEMDLPDYGSTEAAPLELVLDDQPAEEEASEEEYVEEEPAEEDVSPEEVDRQEEPEDSQGDYEDQIEEPAEEEEIIESAPEDEDISPAMDEEPVSAAAAEDAEKEQENESVDVPSDPVNTEESDRGGAVVYEQDGGGEQNGAGSGDGGASGGHSGPGVFTTEDGGPDAGTESVDENGQWDKTTAFFLQEDADGRENGEGLPQTFFTTEEDAETGLLADEGDPGKEMLDPKTFFTTEDSTTEDSDSEDKEGVEAKEDGDGQDDGKAAEGRTGEAADAASEAGTGTLTASAANAGEKEAGTGSTAEKAGDAGTAGTAEAASAAGTGSTSEAEEPEEESGIFFQGAAATLTFEGPDYIVTASYGEDAGIPEGAELVVSEITEDDDQETFQNYSDQVEAAVVPDEGTKESEVVRTVSRVRLFDIKIMAGGVEIEPRGPVSVQIAYQESIVQEEGEEVSTVHFEGKKETPRVLDSRTETADTSPAENDQVSFETDGFSVFAVVVTRIEKIILAGDGHNYRISVTCGANSGIPEGARLEAVEILQSEEAEDGATEYDIYMEKTKEALGIESGVFGYARFFDIKIVDEKGEKVEITSPVDVKIELADKETGGEDTIQVLHFADGSESGEVVDITTETAQEGQIVSFEAEGFSVYAVVDAPEPVITEGTVVQNLQELARRYAYASGFYLSYGSGQYFTNTLNGNSAFVETSNMAEASRWYFETVEGSENTYVIYTYVNNEKQYMQNTGGNLAGLTADLSSAVSFEISLAADGKFYFKKSDEDKYLQHSGSGSGIRFWTDNNNNTNSRIFITYATEGAMEDDPYSLDGKTYGIAYHDEAATSAALTAESMTVKVDKADQNRLSAMDMLMRPDVLNHDGVLLVAEDSDIREWTFHNIGEDKYYISTEAGGETKYLTISGGNVTLTDDPDEISSVITATPGTGSNSGKWHFTVNGYSLNLPGGSSNGFNASTGGGDTTWMNLVEKSVLSDDDFKRYVAKKVSVSDTANVGNGQQVVIYTRIWNDTVKRYEFYAVDHDGTLVRCYDTGDNIEWIGTQVNTALWEFTEYKNSDGTLNYYYELQNTQYGNYIAPQVSGGQTMSGNTIGINLNGRRYGENYTTIIAWDDVNYQYVGLKTENGKVAACPLSEAEDFYFAIINPIDEDDELSTVTTIDNNDYGITMKMIDFENEIVNGRDSVQHAFFGARPSGYEPGLLSTDLDDTTGYPSTTSLTGTERSLGDLFTGMTDVNELFLQSIYNESGYFEYDSTQNFATLLDEEGNLTDTFTVYDQLAAIGTSAGPTRTHGQFMPYNSIEAGKYAFDDRGNPMTNQTDVLAKELPDSDPRKGETLYSIPLKDADYFFGMQMEAGFTQTASGLDAWGHDIIFEFSGDDDFWLYVDGELVLDLGGVRPAMTGTVNFRTGQIVSSGKITLKTATGTKSTNTYTIREVFESNYRTRNPNAAAAEVADYLAQYFDEGSTVFKDYTNHTMSMFYMERGAGASNLHMRFNLATVKPGTIVLSKKLSGAESESNSLIEFPYQIYYRQEADGETQYHLLGEKEGDTDLVTYRDSITPVTYMKKFKPRGGSKEYEHVFMLKPGESAVIDLPDDTTQYYIVECGVNPQVYDRVKANGVTLEGTPADDSGRMDYAVPEAGMKERAEVDYDNRVSEGAMRTLDITKLLYDVDGTERLHFDAKNGEKEDKTLFSFRLYLGNENEEAGSLPAANMYPYHVKDRDGNYCVWDDAAQRFRSLGIRDFADLQSSKYIHDATFTTSMNGAISKIPADYTVEVRGLVVGTRYMVEERDNEIPRGYTLRLSDGYTRIEGDGSETANGTTPYSDTLDVDETPQVQVRNQKGWGLSIEKNWTDADFMEAHDDVYFAVYTKSGSGEETTYDLLEDSVRCLQAPAASLYYFFGNLHSTTPFSDYVVREVTLTQGDDFQVDTEGYVTGYTDLTPVEEGGSITIGGTPVGGEHRDADQGYTYTVHYVPGDQTTQNENVRTDTVTNSIPGLEIYKTDWKGDPLPGAVFTLQDAGKRNVASNTFTSREEDGLVTIAYLPEGTFTLAEKEVPKGYEAMAEPLTIRVGDNNEVTVEGPDRDLYTVTKDNGQMAATITVRNRPASLTVKKVDASTGDPIEGVTFALYRQVLDHEGKPRKDLEPMKGCEAMTTDENGVLDQLTLDLPANTYYLTETKAAAGYEKLAEDVIFTIGKDGRVSINSDGHAGWLQATVNEETGSHDSVITIPNGKMKKVSFLKVDQTYPDTPLAGAVFDLYRVVDGEREDSAYITGLSSGEGGLLAKDESNMFALPPGSYRLVETKAPEEYTLRQDAVEITITEETDAESKEFGMGKTIRGLAYREGTNLSDSGSGIRYDAETHVYTLKISNVKTEGAILPATGGPGTGFYRLTGGLLTFLAGLFLMRRRKLLKCYNNTGMMN